MESYTTQERVLWGPVRIPSDSERVVDADEEVFILYSDLQAGVASETSPETSFRGLGHVDSRKDTMSITFELSNPAISIPASSSLGAEEVPVKLSHRHKKTIQKKDKFKVTGGKTITIELAQDKTALRTRKGDTGSVLWKARFVSPTYGHAISLNKSSQNHFCSVDFARLVLQQLHDQNFADAAETSLLDSSVLKNHHVVELGFGNLSKRDPASTGLLAIALAPHVSRYTVTDIAALVPLLRKNVSANFPGWPFATPTQVPGSKVFVEELDWIVLASASLTQRPKILADISPADLVLVVDSIYHPSLLLPLIETLHELAVPGRTAVLVVVELRGEEVIREFLELWLAQPGWEVWRVGDGEKGAGGMGRPYAMWLGWRN
ncbi:hypothetical protein H0H81_011908 [Sphagnurus paluster]|uniref:Uncharacterized protein n=1 Tax=Sphagnurus paluster TaxID=117069 RepID=A0A9P7G142_9AGAR|nr:hypothetical protein H0H81_011908 [Sphagnurus paluster]